MNDPKALLDSRRARLARLLQMAAPDIIVAAEMRLVARSQREVHGRRWDRVSLRERFYLWRLLRRGFRDE